MEPIEQLRSQLDMLESIAQAASQDRGSGTPSGEHWQWECGECDKVLAITDVVLLDEALACPQSFCHSYRVFLRSAENYPTSVGLLPHFVVGGANEQRPVDALHIQTWDPARVLRYVDSMQKIIDACEAYPSPLAEEVLWQIAVQLGEEL